MYKIANSCKHIVETRCVPGARATVGCGVGCFRESENTRPGEHTRVLQGGLG